MVKLEQIFLWYDVIITACHLTSQKFNCVSLEIAMQLVTWKIEWDLSSNLDVGNERKPNIYSDWGIAKTMLFGTALIRKEICWEEKRHESARDALLNSRVKFQMDVVKFDHLR